MKFTVTFKTPDVVEHALVDIHDFLSEDENLDEENAHRMVKKTLEKFIQYGEQIRVEFDSETQSARVLPV